MRVLVTGGAGFIGSNLCEALLREGEEVICVDNFNSYYSPALKRKNVSALRDYRGFKLVEGDIGDGELMNRIISEGIDYIFHHAALAGVQPSIEDPATTHKVNATGTLNILRCSIGHNIKKVINVSSSSVYGKVSYLPFDEDHPQQPLSPYGVSKLAAEHYCRVFHEISDLPIVSLRYFTVYGPGMRPDLAISIFARRALRNETIEIFGDGSKTRDFVYVEDVVEATLLAAKRGSSKVYNIGGGKSISINELAGKIIDITNSKSKIVRTEPLKGDAEHTCANIDRARKDLGWMPRVTLAEGLNRYISSLVTEGGSKQP